LYRIATAAQRFFAVGAILSRVIVGITAGYFGVGGGEARPRTAIQR